MACTMALPVAGPNINWIYKSTTYIIEILVLLLVITPTTNHIDYANVGYCMFFHVTD
jgi:hypothetical protein